MANQEQIKILRQGVDCWNHWREKNPKIKPDLSNFDSDDFDEFGLNLSNGNFENTDFYDAYLPFVDLENANLCHTNFQNANLDHANFNNSKLHNASFINATLSDAEFINSALWNSDFEKSDLYGANFQNANLTNSSLRNCLIGATNFSKAILRNVDFTDADLASVLESDFTNADLTGICIGGWKIHKSSDFTNVKCDYIFLASAFSEDKQKYIFRSQIPVQIPNEPKRFFNQGEFDKFCHKNLLQKIFSLFFHEL